MERLGRCPRLRERGLGDGRLVRTLRTYGIGESHVAERLGEPMLRGANPVVATYARADWLDIRISAVDETDDAGQPDRDRRGAPRGDRRARPRDARRLRARRGRHVVGGPRRAEAATRAGVRLAVVEAGTHGTLGALLAGRAGARARRDATARRSQPTRRPGRSRRWPPTSPARQAWRSGSALVAHADTNETRLRVAVAAPDPGWSRVLDLRLFQHGAHGRFRAAVAAAAFIVEVLDERSADTEGRSADSARGGRPTSVGTAGG